MSNSQPNWTRTLALSTTLAVLLGGVWWLQTKHEPEQETQSENAKKPFTFGKDASVTRIVVSNGDKSYDWKCVGDVGKPCVPGGNARWDLQAPLKAHSDDTNVNSLLSSIERLQATDTFELKEETPEKRATILKEYGLSPADLASPTLRKVRVETVSQGAWTAFFGGTHPVNEGIFTIVERDEAGKPPGKPNDTHVFLTPTFFKSTFDHDLNYWRDKKLLALDSSAVESFRLEGKLGGGASGAKSTWIEGVKKGNQWTLHSPEGDYVGDIEAIDNMLQGTSFLVAKSIVSESKTSPEAKKALQGTQPLLSLTLHKIKTPADKEAPAPIVLSVFEKVGDKAAAKKPANPEAPSLDLTQLYATVSTVDTLFELQNGARNQIGKTLKDLRLNKLITSADRFGAKKLEFSGKLLGATPLTLTQQNTKWQINDGGAAADSKVQSTLDKLSGNRITDFLPAGKTPAGESNGTEMKLWTDPAGAPVRDLLFWIDGGKLYARNLLAAHKDVYALDLAVWQGIPGQRDFFKETAPSPVPKNK